MTELEFVLRHKAPSRNASPDAAIWGLNGFRGLEDTKLRRTDSCLKARFPLKEPDLEDRKLPAMEDLVKVGNLPKRLPGPLDLDDLNPRESALCQKLQKLEEALKDNKLVSGLQGSENELLQLVAQHTADQTKMQPVWRNEVDTLQAELSAKVVQEEKDLWQGLDDLWEEKQIGVKPTLHTQYYSQLMKGVSEALDVEKGENPERLQLSVRSPAAQPASPSMKLRYKKGNHIGTGGFGTVSVGLNSETGELIAVKNIPFDPKDPQISEKLQLLKREIDLMKSLKNPYIVRYLATEREGNSMNLLMEYVSGGSISSLLSQFGPLCETVVQRYTMDILKGITYLHDQNVVHRDIKGANILLDTNGTCKLADFGAANIVDNIAGLSLASIRGTPHWMAPEVLTQSGHTWSADIWSLGCTILEMLTAQPPFQHIARSQIRVMHYIAEPDSAITLPEGIPSAIVPFLMSVLRRNPEERPSSRALMALPYLASVSLLSSPSSKEFGSPRHLNSVHGSPRMSHHSPAPHRRTSAASLLTASKLAASTGSGDEDPDNRHSGDRRNSAASSDCGEEEELKTKKKSWKKSSREKDRDKEFPKGVRLRFSTSTSRRRSIQSREVGDEQTTPRSPLTLPSPASAKISGNNNSSAPRLLPVGSTNPPE